MEVQVYYRRKLLETLAERQRRNTSYSLRAFARFLGVQPPTLSAILNGKRNLPAKQAALISERLGLTPIEKQKFMSSVTGAKLSLREFMSAQVAAFDAHTLEEELHHRIIAEWEHYAILSLIDTKGFKSDPKHIAQRLGITPLRAASCIENLKQAKLVAQTKTLRKSHEHLRTTDDVSSTALRQSHKEELDMAKAKLDETALELRDYSSMTVALNLEKISEAKELIKRFRREFATLVEKDSQKNEVYQLCVQLFPLTRSKKNAVQKDR